MKLDSAVQTFIAESSELLEAMEEALLRLEHEPSDADLINALFRSAHTIKGSAGVFGFDDLVAFAHHVESVLHLVREERVTVSAELVAHLLICCDYIRTLIAPATTGQALDEDTQAKGEALVAQLRLYLEPCSQAPPSVPDPCGLLSALPEVVVTEESVAATDAWHISLRFGLEVLRNGMDPLSFLRYLATLGDIVSLTTLTDALPEIGAMDPEACYLGFEIGFESQADKATIEGVFEFVQDDCVIRILPPRCRIAAYIQLIRELPEDTMRLGEILVMSGALTPTELARGLHLQVDEAVRPQSSVTPDKPLPRLGEILIQKGAVDAAVVDAALEKQQQVKEHRAHESQFIRVEAEKLDQLMNLVGELVITGAGTHLLARHAGSEALLESTSTLSRLIEEVRNTTLSLRMVQIGTTFNRFQRVVHDVSHELQKDIELVISGGETELDKSVVEKIGDPLMHLVRNAMDHGIEPTEVRLARGKPAKAQVRLHAYHDSGSIVIEVADDGGGLRRDKILQKAMERGRLSPAQELSDRDVFNLVFEPGFSTADQISNLSGRGVGLDVVRRNIEALRGTVEIESQAGVGTMVRIRLPLTLAVIDGFLVGVGQARYVIPLDMVVECVELPETDHEAASGDGYVNLRGQVLPFLHLRTLFALNGQTRARENIVVIQGGGVKAGLVVDTLLGECQTVIKPLGKLFGHLKGCSGFTILGTGEVALILDVSGLIQKVMRRSTPAVNPEHEVGTLHHSSSAGGH